MISQLKKLVIIFCAALLAIIVFIPAFIFANELGQYGGTGSLNISPESGPGNTAISIEGKGFKPEEVIRIVMYRNDEEQIFINNILSDDEGNIRFSFLIPSNVGIGYYKIEAKGSELILWADYYVTAEGRFNLLTFILSVCGAFLTGAGLMYLGLTLYQRRQKKA